VGEAVGRQWNDRLALGYKTIFGKVDARNAIGGGAVLELKDLARWRMKVSEGQYGS